MLNKSRWPKKSPFGSYINIDKREDKGRSVVALNTKLNPHYAKARLQFSPEQ